MGFRDLLLTPMLSVSCSLHLVGMSLVSTEHVADRRSGWPNLHHTVICFYMPALKHSLCKKPCHCLNFQICYNFCAGKKCWIPTPIIPLTRDPFKFPDNFLQYTDYINLFSKVYVGHLINLLEQMLACYCLIFLILWIISKSFKSLQNVMLHPSISRYSDKIQEIMNHELYSHSFKWSFEQYSVTLLNLYDCSFHVQLILQFYFFYS